jgi:predicted ATPase
VPALQNAIHSRDELHREITQLRNIGSNFKDIVRVGKALQAAKAAVALQPLSEEDYLTLAEKHTAVVEDVTYQCERLADAEDYDALEALEAQAG